MPDEEILKKAIEAWGPEAQEDASIEEMAELIKALLKYRRERTDPSHVQEEIVDVQIVLDQLKILFFDSDVEYDELKQKKLAQLSKLIRKESIRKEAAAKD